MSRTPIIAAAALALLPSSARPSDGAAFRVGGDDAASIGWTRKFESSGDDWINDLVPLRSGEVLAVGFLDRRDSSPPSDWQAVAAELAWDGRLANERRYGLGRGIDAFWSVTEAADSSRMFAGFTTRFGGGGIDGLALLTDGQGRLRVDRAFGAAGYDRFTDIVAAEDGYVFVGHSQPSDGDKRRVFVVKTDLAGQPLWQRVHDAPDSWGALYVEPSGDRGYIIAGGTSAGGDGDMFAMKVDAEGRELWRRKVGTPDRDEVNHGLVMRPDGRIVLVGYTHKRGEEDNDLVAATLTRDGEVERIERFGGTGDDRAILAKADAANRVWIVGHTASAGAGGIDLLLARLDAGGSFDEPALTVGGPDDDRGTALLPGADGSLLLAGYSTGLGGGGQDAFVLRLSAPGWSRPHPSFQRELVTAPRRAG